MLFITSGRGLAKAKTIIKSSNSSSRAEIDLTSYPRNALFLTNPSLAQTEETEIPSLENCQHEGRN